MKKFYAFFIIFMTAFVFSGFSHACTIQASGIPDDVKQALVVECEKARLAEASKPPLSALDKAAENISAEKVNQWGDISKKFAEALGIAAREIGISVNQFIVTPAGIITIALIVWAVFGKSMLILGSCFFVWFVIWAVCRTILFKKYETVEREFLWWKWKTEVRRNETYDNLSESAIAWMLISAVVGVAYTAIAMINI